MSHQDRRRWSRSPRSLLAQGCERLSHQFGFGESTFPRDSFEGGGSLRVDSDIQGGHCDIVSRGVIQSHVPGSAILPAGEFVHLGKFFG